MVIENEIQRTVKEFKEKYGHSKDAFLPILQGVQVKFKYIPEDAIKCIAQELCIYEAEIYGVITFYAQFRLEPVGDNIIKVCKGTACHVGGAETVGEAVSDILGIKVNGTTKDNKFTLEYVACLGCCSLAPVMMINDEVYAHLTKDKIKEVLKNYA
jgi:NADH-quinone oxidoreductase subunit E